MSFNVFIWCDRCIAPESRLIQIAHKRKLINCIFRLRECRLKALIGRSYQSMDEFGRGSTVESFTEMSIGRLHSARLVGQHNAQQRAVDFEMAVVIDKA